MGVAVTVCISKSEKYDTTLEYCRDLPCGLSVYAGFCKKDLNWRWLVYDAEREVDERGTEESFESARREAKRVAGSLLRQSLQELMK